MKLKLNGNEYELNFGLGAFEIAEERLSMSMEEIMMRLNDSKVFNNFVYSALLNAIRIKDDTAKEPFGYYEFLDYINELEADVNNELTKAILSTTFRGKTFSEMLGIEIEEPKKEQKKRTTKKVEVPKQS